MKNTLKFLFSIILAVWLLGAPAPASAQGGDEPENIITGFSTVTLDILAEYDDPYGLGGNLLLVILEGEISANVPPKDMAADVSFVVPSDAIMYSAGYRDASGAYRKGYDYDGPPERQDSGIPGWDLITITMEGDTFVIEYYDPGIITGNTDRNISYQFRWLYPIINLGVLIQAPLDAKDFTVTPEGQFNSYQGYESYFFQFSNLAFSGLESQQPLTFDISYSFGVRANPLLIVGIIIGAFIIIAVVLFWRSNRSGGSTRAERRRVSIRHPARQETAGPKGGAPAKFCRHCGVKLGRPSKFCPHCGEKI
jgi:hypothetical protein